MAQQMLDILVLSDLPPSPKVHHHKNYLKTRIVLSIDPVTTSQLPPGTQRSIFQVLTHGCVDKISRFFQARARARKACALRALGLLLADGTPTVGGGKTF